MNIYYLYLLLLSFIIIFIDVILCYIMITVCLFSGKNEFLSKLIGLIMEFDREEDITLFFRDFYLFEIICL